MNLARIQDALDMRSARCPICHATFEDTFKERKPPKRTTTGAARALQISGLNMQEFVIKKRTITLKIEQPKTHFSLSTVNGSVRMKCDTMEDVWQDKTLNIICKNNRHSYTMTICFLLNRFRLETKNYRLIAEVFSFRDEGKSYVMNIDYVEKTTFISDPVNPSSLNKTKPSILEVTNKKDIIQKIDRLFNFA